MYNIMLKYRDKYKIFTYQIAVARVKVDKSSYSKIRLCYAATDILHVLNHNTPHKYFFKNNNR